MNFFYENKSTKDELVKDVLCQMAKIYIDDKEKKVYKFCHILDCNCSGEYIVTYQVCYNYPRATYLSNEEEVITVCEDCLEHVRYTHHIISSKKMKKN